ncbi:MAG TPA: YHS domain-containing protein [Pirellulaceae bacterium]|nr:YHS domain-containing protein [Pirellulaceae bacterium]
MSDLQTFRRELKARTAAAGKAPSWRSADFDHYMADLQPRRTFFDDTAGTLIAVEIRPRLEALVEQFPGARIMREGQAYRCACWFAQSDRFPVTAKLEFDVEHDKSLQHLYVCSEICLMPVFWNFQPHDKLTLRLDEVDQQRVADWIEQRIFEFLDVYLLHDRGTDDLEEDIVSDPVCGMRLRRSEAREAAEYRGHAYFFCASDCREKFQANPEKFVTLRTM